MYTGSIIRGETMVIEETEAQILERVKLKFEDLAMLTHGVVQGHIRALVVEGDAGIGKTFGIKQIFDKYSAVDKSGVDRFEIVKGTISSLFIYMTFYKYRQKGMVTVFDDCQIKANDTDAMNILKHALDTGDERNINWYKASSVLAKENVPTKYAFDGGVIYVTNSSLMSGKKSDEHMAAIVSRCHYVNMRLTDIEKVVWIKHIVNPMLAKYYLEEHEIRQILDFVITNLPILRELSLRTVTKIADLFVAYPDRWSRMAMASVCM